ncbi:MAG: PQQ-like beta-propeller repeat protein, partial [Armatimonadetes bacterium]|nr:PQQ-like beta-propeller repeat protein [Armatimonadota bacterium]
MNRFSGWMVVVLLAGLGLASSDTTAPELRSTVEQEWPMRRHDASRASVTSNEVKPPLGACWSIRVPKQWRFGDHCPLLFNRRVLVFANATYKSIVLCLDADSGKQLWVRKFTGESEPKWIIEAIGDSETDQLFVLTRAHGHQITALSAADGSIIWSRDAPGVNGFTLAQGKLFLSENAGDNAMYHLALSAETREVLWREQVKETPLPDFDRIVPAPAVTTDLAVFDTNGKAIFGRNPETGELLWRYEPTHDYHGQAGNHYTSLILSEGRLIFRDGGSIYSLRSDDVTRGPRGDYYLGALRAAVAFGRVFTQWKWQQLACLDLSSMNKLWLRRAPVSGFPAASANLVWVATRKDRRRDVPSLRAYDPDGRLVWLTPGRFGEPAIAYNRIYLTGPELVTCLEHNPQGAPFRNLELTNAGRPLT